MEKIKIASLFALISIAFLFPLFHTIMGQIIAMLIIYAIGAFYFRFNILYPFVWLTPFILLYNTSVVILDWLGVRQASFKNEIIICTYIAIMTFFLFCFLFIKQDGNKVNVSYMKESLSSLKGTLMLRRILLLLGIVLLLYIPLFFKLGFSSKAEMSLYGGLPGFELFSVLFKFFYLLYLTYASKYLRIFPLKWVFYALLVSASISVFIGERDILLAIVLFSFCVYYSFFSPTKRQILTVVVLGLILVPISSQFKQITPGEPVDFSEFNMIESFLSGEFFSSGRNIETLMENSEQWSFQYGASLFKDVLRAIFPSHLITVDNSTGWFNHTFNSREDAGLGLGFSYLGEGYLQCGYFGVMAWIVMLSLILRLLYYHSKKSIWGFSIYIYMIGSTIYSMRGDFSYILSPLIKHVLLVYLIYSLIIPMHMERSKHKGVTTSN